MSGYPSHFSNGNMDAPGVVPRLRGVLDDFGWRQGFLADLHAARNVAAFPSLPPNFDWRSVEADVEVGEYFCDGWQGNGFDGFVGNEFSL